MSIGAKKLKKPEKSLKYLRSGFGPWTLGGVGVVGNCFDTVGADGSVGLLIQPLRDRNKRNEPPPMTSVPHVQIPIQDNLRKTLFLKSNSVGKIGKEKPFDVLRTFRTIFRNSAPAITDSL